MSLQARAARNRVMPCRVPECSNHRAALSPYCSGHLRRVERWGDPRGRSIPRREYAGEREHAERFIEEHAEHPAIVAALAFLRRWMDEAKRGQRVPGQREAARLAEHGVEPRAILAEAVGLYLYAQARPHALPDDARLTFQLGAKVLALAPGEKRFSLAGGAGRYRSRPTPKTARRAAGEYLRAYLGPLMGNVHAALEAEHARRQEYARAIRQPFNEQK